MKHIKILLTLILFSGSLFLGKCGGYASWWQETPSGNEIYHENRGNGYEMGINCKNRDSGKYNQDLKITGLQRWYFYKDHIIGDFIQNSQSRHFIFNELKCEAQIFSSPRALHQRLDVLHLKPKIWTRWYTSNWGVILTSGHLGDQLTYAYIKLPILVFTAIVVLVGLALTRFNLKHTFNKVSLSLTALIILRLMLDVLPSSM